MHLNELLLIWNRGVIECLLWYFLRTKHLEGTRYIEMRQDAKQWPCDYIAEVQLKVLWKIINLWWFGLCIIKNVCVSCSLTRLTLFLLVLHYVVELIFHASRLLYFSEKSEIANPGSVEFIWNLFVSQELLKSTTLLEQQSLWGSTRSYRFYLVCGFGNIF